MRVHRGGVVMLSRVSLLQDIPAELDYGRRVRFRSKLREGKKGSNWSRLFTAVNQVVPLWVVVHARLRIWLCAQITERFPSISSWRRNEVSFRLTLADFTVVPIGQR